MAHGCIMLHQEVKKINRKEQLSLVVMHDDFVGDDNSPQELHALKKYWKDETEGDEDYLFNAVVATEEPPE